MIGLRPYKACDAQYIVSWIKEEYSFRQWSADRFDSYPIDAERLNKYYDDFKDRDDHWQMTAFDERGVVGHLIMRFSDDDKKTVRFGFVILDSAIRGRGYGKEMLQLAVKFAFEILKASKVTLGVFENNMPAYYCYKSIGFRETLPEKTTYYRLLNEDWKCIEMELVRA